MQMLHHHQCLFKESFHANELRPDNNAKLYEIIGLYPIKRFGFLLKSLKEKLITILPIIFNITFLCNHSQSFFPIGKE